MKHLVLYFLVLTHCGLIDSATEAVTDVADGATAKVTETTDMLNSISSGLLSLSFPEDLIVDSPLAQGLDDALGKANEAMDSVDSMTQNIDQDALSKTITDAKKAMLVRSSFGSSARKVKTMFANVSKARNSGDANYAQCLFEFSHAATGTAECYGPALGFVNHPDTSAHDNHAGKNGFLPSGDLGIWDENEGTEACIAAKMNKEIATVSHRVETAKGMMAMMLCAATVDGVKLPEVGKSENLISSLNKAVDGKNIGGSFASASIERLSDTDKRPTYKSMLTYTDTTNSETVTITIKHIALDDHNKTYRGKLWMSANDSGTSSSPQNQQPQNNQQNQENQPNQNNPPPPGNQPPPGDQPPPLQPGQQQQLPLLVSSNCTPPPGVTNWAPPPECQQQMQQNGGQPNGNIQDPGVTGNMGPAIDNGGDSDSCRNSGSSNQTGISILYEKLSATDVRYELRTTTFPSTYTDDQMFDAKKNVVAPCGNGGEYALFALNPEDNTGKVAYSWIAGSARENTRAFIAEVKKNGDTKEGCGYFGFGDSIIDVLAERESIAPGKGLSSFLNQFICNWAGPGNNHSSKNELVQRQCMKQQNGIYTATESAIAFSPQNDCQSGSGSSFELGRSSGSNAMGNTNAEESEVRSQYTLKASAANHSLIDISTLDAGTLETPIPPSEL